MSTRFQVGDFVTWCGNRSEVGIVIADEHRGYYRVLWLRNGDLLWVGDNPTMLTSF